MSAPPVAPRLAALVVGLFVLGCARALLLWGHAPMYAYANSYDQARYTACFDIFPDRPASVPPVQNSPLAPFEGYRFIAAGDPMCYWSSELAFGALVAGAWHAAEALGGDSVHSVRAVGALRLLALAALAIAFARACWRRGNRTGALAHAALFAVLFCDPGNTLYLNTFYAEWSALLAAYALVGSLVLWRDAAATRMRFALVALAALLLATSKIQHLVLPLALACVLGALAAWQRRGLRWPVLALGLGALAGAALQLVQLGRDGDMMDSIRQYNRADVVFTALLPLVEDKAAFLADHGIEPRCVGFSGRNAWMLPDMPERACPGVLAFGLADGARVLLADPVLGLRLGVRAVLALHPWLAANIGHVQGRELGRLPASTPSLGHALAAAPTLQLAVLGAPLLALVLLAGRRRDDARVDLSAIVVAILVATLGVTVLGDGLADTAKQGHLVVNAALAWWIVALVAALPRAAAKRPRTA